MVPTEGARPAPAVVTLPRAGGWWASGRRAGRLAFDQPPVAIDARPVEVLDPPGGPVDRQPLRPRRLTQPEEVPAVARGEVTAAGRMESPLPAAGLQHQPRPGQVAVVGAGQLDPQPVVA